MAKSPRRRVYAGNTNLVKQYSAFAEQWLKNFQQAGKAPKKMSGVLNIRFGDYVMVFQYDNNRLVGCLAIHVNNAANAAQKLIDGANGVDVAALINAVDAAVEEEVNDGEPTE